MTTPQNCPVCLDRYSSKAANVERGADGWGYRVSCLVCGRYDVTQSTWEDYLDPESFMGKKLTPPARARLSHKLRTTSSRVPADLPKIDKDTMQSVFDDGIAGPTPAQQAQNIIRLIGDCVANSGSVLGKLPEDFYAIVGAPNPEMASKLVVELRNRGWIDGVIVESANAPPLILNSDLTLSGWEQYEAERRGTFASAYGFAALKFNEPSLDQLLHDFIKPCVKSELGYDVVDMRDVARAGVIDNIMRAQIRDAAFVLVDLTHDNLGAYWEAGYAEGLGKPVIYICEKTKFDSAKTHFDTNHCTTVSWQLETVAQFQKELIATLRRSLNLFASE